MPPKPPHGYFLDLAGPGVGGGSGRAPKPLPALPFLVRRKGSKRLFRGCPPKDPQGERSGRVPLSPPRPGSFVVGVSLSRAKGCALVTGKTLRLIILLCHRTTARQAVALISGAGCPETSQCNLSLFRSGRAERSSRVGLRPNALAFRKTVRQKVSSETLTSVDPL